MLANWFKARRESRTVRRLKRELTEVTAERDRLAAVLRIVEAERDTLALVAARDRQRVRSEMAGYAVDEAQGMKRHDNAA